MKFMSYIIILVDIVEINELFNNKQQLYQQVVFLFLYKSFSKQIKNIIIDKLGI
jgi:hypothetical protein